jgi:hypothetical protein
MGARCSNLALFSNPCAISKCVAHTQILFEEQSFSGSNSLQMVLTLNGGTHYNGNPVKTVFLKLFPNVNSPILQTHNRNASYAIGLKALLYETAIYKTTIDPIVSQKMCPFFPIVYAVGLQCSYEDIQELLNLSPSKNLLSLLNNRLFPSIFNDPTLNPVQQVQYCCLLIENLYEHPNTVSLGQFYIKSARSYIGENSVSSLQNLKSTWFSILFQIVYGLLVLKYAGVAHNDFHLENVIITTLPQPLTLCLGLGLFNTKYYAVTTRHIIKIIDFDHSSFMPYDNEIVETLGCRAHSCTPSVREPQDFVRLVLNMLYLYQPDAQVNRVDSVSFSFFMEPVLRLLCKNQDSIDLLLDISKQSQSITVNHQGVNHEFFEQFNSLEHILNGLAELCDIPVTTRRPANTKQQDCYFVDPLFFDQSLVKVSDVSTTLQEPTVQQVRDLEITVAQQRYDMSQLI